MTIASHRWQVYVKEGHMKKVNNSHNTYIFYSNHMAILLDFNHLGKSSLKIISGYKFLIIWWFFELAVFGWIKKCVRFSYVKPSIVGTFYKIFFLIILRLLDSQKIGNGNLPTFKIPQAIFKHIIILFNDQKP